MHDHQHGLQDSIERAYRTGLDEGERRGRATQRRLDAITKKREPNPWLDATDAERYPEERLDTCEHAEWYTSQVRCLHCDKTPIEAHAGKTFEQHHAGTEGRLPACPDCGAIDTGHRKGMNHACSCRAAI